MIALVTVLTDYVDVGSLVYCVDLILHIDEHNHECLRTYFSNKIIVTLLHTSSIF